MIRPFRLVALLALSVFASASGHAERPERNEQQARRFLFCMNVSQFFYEYLRKHDPQNPGLPGYRESRIYYRLAAVLLSDGDFMLRESQTTLQEMIAILEREKSEKRNLLDAEAVGCAQTLKDEVVPLILRAGGTR